MIGDLIGSVVQGQWGLQSPIMLLALLSLFIPIVIHLFSKSRSRLISIGDIRFITVKKIKRVTEIHLIEPLLLALRMFLLLLISFLLAQFYLTGGFQTTAKRTTLVTQDWLNLATQSEKQALAEQFSNADNHVLLLGTTGERASALSIEMLQSVDNSVEEDVVFVNVWQQVRQVLALLGSTDDVTVYTTDRLSQFVGQKPAGLSHVKWSIKSTPAADVTLNEQTFEILVISDANRRDDSQYINAALTVLRERVLTGLKVTNLDTVDETQIKMDNTPDTIFYLSDKPLSAELTRAVESGARLITDASNQRQVVETSVNSQLHIDKFRAPSVVGGFELHQMGMSLTTSKITTVSSSQIIWRTISGAALLISNPIGQGEIYAFYSRFNPNWSNWVLKSHFPYDLAQLLMNNSVETEFSQKLLSQIKLTREQISQQELLSSPANEAQNQHEYVDASQEEQEILLFLLVLIVVTFCLERILSELTLRQSIADNNKVIDQTEAAK
jgi:hypothetical protein